MLPSLGRTRLAILLAVLSATIAAVPARAACEGKFVNPLSAVCWSCIFPITFGASTLIDNDQLGGDNPGSLLCACGQPPKIGFAVGFFEPVRVVEITRTPYCFSSLGGLQLYPGIPARQPGMRTGSSGSGDSRGTASFAFYQAHWYVNPILHWLEVLLDFDCLERAGWDLAYLSELDPTWEDDQLAAILHPEMLLTANLAGVAACAADCIAATSGWPLEELWWCAGCGGPLYPLTGNIAAHVSGRQSSALLAARMVQKMHRQFATHYRDGKRGLCSAGWYAARLRKKAYKMAMIHPRPQAKQHGRCCQPLGSSPEYWAQQAEWPITGEDFAYLLFRKRDCCSGALGL